MGLLAGFRTIGLGARGRHTETGITAGEVSGIAAAEPFSETSKFASTGRTQVIFVRDALSQTYWDRPSACSERMTAWCLPAVSSTGCPQLASPTATWTFDG